MITCAPCTTVVHLLGISMCDIDLANKLYKLGSGCGSVGRAVASNTRGPWFESLYYMEHLFTVICIEKTKIKKKRPGTAGPFFVMCILSKLRVNRCSIKIAVHWI